MQESCQQNLKDGNRRKWEKAIFMCGIRLGLQILSGEWDDGLREKYELLYNLNFNSGQIVQTIFDHFNLCSTDLLNTASSYCVEFITEEQNARKRGY